MRVSGLNKALLLFIPLALMCGNAVAEEDRWTSRGHIGEGIDALVVNPKNPLTLYAGLGEEYRGVYKSNDGGATWVKVSSGLSFGQPSTLAIDPQDTSVVYAGFARDPDLCKTTDGGLSWLKWSEFPTDGVYDLEVDPRDSSVMYAVSGSWFFSSSDGGQTWQSVRTSLWISDLAIDSQGPGRVYAADSEGIYMTSDKGWAWEKVSNERFSAIAIDPRNPACMYTSYGLMGFGDVFKSKDGGHTWSKMTQMGMGGLSAYVIAIGSLSSSTSIIYIGTRDGVFSITQSVDTTVYPVSWGAIKAQF